MVKIYLWQNLGPWGTFLGPLLPLIYKNDLTQGSAFNIGLFADNTSLFSVARDIRVSAKELNEDLNKTDKWAFQWKMNFNPDPNKKVQEVLFSFSRKPHKESHPKLFFNNALVLQKNFQKHYRMVLY